MMEKIELRILFDCEKNEKILQYRYRDENQVDRWADVPVVYSFNQDLKTQRDSEKISNSNNS